MPACAGMTVLPKSVACMTTPLLLPIKGIHASLNQLIALRVQARTLNLSSRKQVATFANGPQSAHFRGRGVDFDEVRIYQAGDDIRNMDWRVTARSNRPHTKLFREERERPVFLLVDQGPSMFFGTRVAFRSTCYRPSCWRGLPLIAGIVSAV